MLTHIDPALVRPELAPFVPKLLSGWAGAFHIGGTDAEIVVSVGVTRDTDEIAIWVEELTGTVGNKPKANLKLMRDVLDEVGQLGRPLGCTELRIETGERPQWKGALLPALGFARVGSYYRKALTDG
jgi:hypothetical protein